MIILKCLMFNYFVKIWDGLCVVSKECIGEHRYEIGGQQEQDDIRAAVWLSKDEIQAHGVSSVLRLAVRSAVLFSSYVEISQSFYIRILRYDFKIALWEIRSEMKFSHLRCDWSSLVDGNSPPPLSEELSTVVFRVGWSNTERRANRFFRNIGIPHYQALRLHATEDSNTALHKELILAKQVVVIGGTGLALSFVVPVIPKCWTSLDLLCFTNMFAVT
jgi:hypothetical protein